MKTGFKDPIAPRPGQKKKSPWDFRCPPYDERTSHYVNAGTHQGLGHRQPVGHEGDPKMRASTLPFGRVNLPELSPVPSRQLEQEYVD